jgi:RNA polymerase sigma-70 factor, ECF subfamily
VYQRALRLVQHQVEGRTLTAFRRATVESRGTAQVAAELGITPNAVRLAKSHVLRRLREEMGKLIA